MASGCVIWVTGLSSSGKTTLCNAICGLVKQHMPELVVLDGEGIRAAFGSDLGYTEQDRITQLKRLQNTAKLLADQDMAVIVAAVYAHPEVLKWNRANLRDYFEVYLDASLDTVQRRDIKGLYAGAASGKIPNVVGVDIPWNPPEAPDLILDENNDEDAESLARRVIAAVPHLASRLAKRNKNLRQHQKLRMPRELRLDPAAGTEGSTFT